MAVLPVTQITDAGVAPPALVAADVAGDLFANNGLTFLRVTNGGGASINVTFDSVVACNQGFDHDTVVAVPAGATRDCGRWDRTRFGAVVNVSYSSVTSVTVGAFSV